MPADITLRPATLADVEALVAVTTATDATYREWAAKDWTPPPIEEDRAMWEQRLREPGGWCEVAEDPDGRVIGAAAYRPGHEGTHDERGPLIPGLAHISAVFVHPDRWRQGIAAALLRRAEQVMRERGYERAQLFTPVHAPARRFYEAEGWELDGRTIFAPFVGMDLIAYTKQLAPNVA